MSDAFMSQLENGTSIDLDAVLSEEEAASVKAATAPKAKKVKPAPSNNFDGVPVAQLDADGNPIPGQIVQRTPRAPRAPKQPEGPNPWGIHNDAGVVITTSYLRKYMQCACRGETYSLNRAANMAHLTSDTFLNENTGISAGQYSRLCATYQGWFDEKHPAPVKNVRQPKTAPIAVTSVTNADIVTAMSGDLTVDESDILG